MDLALKTLLAAQDRSPCADLQWPLTGHVIFCGMHRVGGGHQTEQPHCHSARAQHGTVKLLRQQPKNNNKC